MRLLRDKYSWGISKESTLMLKVIIKRELLDQLMSAKFAIGVFLCLALLVVGTYLSVKDYERRLQGYFLIL